MPNIGISEIWRIEALWSRLERARQLLADGKVSRDPDNPQQYRVESQAHPGAFYTTAETCGFKDASIRSQLVVPLCKHVLAVILFRSNHNGKT